MKPSRDKASIHVVAEGYVPSRNARLLARAPLSGSAGKSRRGWRRVALLLALTPILALAVALAGFRTAAAFRETGTAVELAPAAGRFLATPAGRMFVLDEGPRDGTPVVLVHGTAAWSEFWRGTIDHLTRAGYRVIALDLPPFGFSERAPSGRYPRAEQATRIIGVLDALRIPSAVFVGHSFGAGATVETVMRHPARTRGVVLVAAALGLPAEGVAPEPPSRLTGALLAMPILTEAVVAATATNPLLTRQLLATMVHRKEGASAELANVLRRPMRLKQTTPDFLAWGRAFLEPDTGAMSMRHESFRMLDRPTEIIWGDRDTITPEAQGRALAALIPGARITVMKDVGHIPQIEAPAAFRPVLVQAIGKVR